MWSRTGATFWFRRGELFSEEARPLLAGAEVALSPPRVCPGIFIVIRFDPFFFTFIMKRVVRFMGVMDRILGVWGVGLDGRTAR